MDTDAYPITDIYCNNSHTRTTVARTGNKPRMSVSESVPALIVASDRMTYISPFPMYITDECSRRWGQDGASVTCIF